MKCVIQWVNNRGEATPDDNEAIGECYMIAHPLIRDDLTVHMLPESKHMPICAEHAAQLPEISYKYPIWMFEPYQEG